MILKQNPYQLFVLAASLMAGALAYAQADPQQATTSPSAAVGSISLADDCTEIDIDYLHDDLLTPEERLARMDDAFFESLSKFDTCQTSQSSASGGASGGGGDAGNAGNAGGAVASPDLTGTDPPADDFPQAGGGNSGSVTAEGKSGAASGTAANQSVSSVTGVNQSGSGKLPDDIPPADNDSVLEAQIRQAATSETDPTARKKLWDEYRKYKGLSRPQNQSEAH